MAAAAAVVVVGGRCRRFRGDGGYQALSIFELQEETYWKRISLRHSEVRCRNSSDPLLKNKNSSVPMGENLAPWHGLGSKRLVDSSREARMFL